MTPVKATMAALCGICHDAQSIYECPVCTLKHCSIICEKTTKRSYDDDEATPIETEVCAEHDRPRTSQRMPKI